MQIFDQVLQQITIDSQIISVIIPTYNRAHLLPQIVPTYLQPGVAEIIIVDDGSTDNTPQVVESLAQKYSIIRYVRLGRNSGQTVAKNTGISIAMSPFIYFGDDDSLLAEGSIAALLACLEREEADIVGARAVYMLPGESVEEVLQRTHRGRSYVIDFRTLRTYFDDDPGRPLVVPFVHACALMRTELAREILFDPAFSGSGYREETDFFLRCAESGAKIIFCPQAVSINLPREVALGGAWKHNWLSYEKSAIANNWRFLNRHYKYLQCEWGLQTPKWLLQTRFIIGRVSFRVRWIAKGLLRPYAVSRLRRWRAMLTGLGKR
ncbi:MAG TPA: glycosyltransferase family 2 protein [Syntrophothermus lipocalidus]|nr:glycosyltransferase family 2 protein [Syntrophothermus lipocalidus]